MGSSGHIGLWIEIEETEPRIRGRIHTVTGSELTSTVGLNVGSPSAGGGDYDLRWNRWT